MLGQSLHEFDLQLCDYALSNIRVFMDEPVFAKWINEELSPPATLDYLREGLDGYIDQERLLLSDEEFDRLAFGFDDSPFVAYSWPPDEATHRRYINTIREVRDTLSQQAADDWSRECARFSEQLEEDQQSLFKGIDTVHEWTRALRRVLKAMGAAAFLPVPKGQSPTPTNPAPAGLLSNSSTVQDEEALAAMREAIRAHERTHQSSPEEHRGRNASPSALTEIAKIRPQRARDALRQLQALNEYSGFARSRPRRYRDGRRNER